jgi:ABC-2 type transport system ATP-binding protein
VAATAAGFDHVHKRYGRLTAVRDISLEVPTGSAFALLGPNRAGKTTLVKLLLSLSRPTSGAITRLGRPARDRRTLGRVGYMHENHAFPRYLSATEVLHLYAGLTGLPSDIIPKRCAELLDRVGLADRGREPISRFSKGMVQRLGLAQALAADPDLLILDEPTEGLDLFGRQLLRDVVAGVKRAGKTVVLVSHVLAEVQELCDEAAVLVAGELAYRGPLADLSAGGGLEAGLTAVYRKGVAA